MEKFDAIYGRQSVDKADSISVESQIEFCTYELRGNTNYKIFTDKGYSGKNTKRPEFQHLMEEIKKGKIKKVIVYKLDRISRSVLDFANMMETFQKYGVEFISCNEKFDTSTPMGRAMLSICIVFAQLERETIQQRVIDAFISRSEKGFYMGGRTSYGYRLEKTIINGINTSKYVICEEEAEQIKLMYELYADPHISVGDILTYFKNHDITMSNGKAWTRARVSDHLKNQCYVRADKNVYDYFASRGAIMCNPPEEYAGTNGCYLYTYKGHGSRYTQLKDRKVVLAPHEGIIDADLWLKCRMKSFENEQIQTARKVINTWLAGVVKCGKCGYALTFKKYKNRNARYLLCSRRMNDKACEGAGTIYADEFEKLIFEKMVQKLKEFETLSSGEKQEQAPPELMALNLQIENIEQELKNLIDKLSSSNKTLTAYINDRVTALDTEKKEIQQKIEKLTKEEQKEKVNILHIKDCIDKWEKLDIRDKQKVAWALIQRIDATSESVKIKWKI